MTVSKRQDLPKTVFVVIQAAEMRAYDAMQSTGTTTAHVIRMPPHTQTNSMIYSKRLVDNNIVERTGLNKYESY